MVRAKAQKKKSISLKVTDDDYAFMLGFCGETMSYSDYLRCLIRIHKNNKKIGPKITDEIEKLIANAL